MSEIKVNKISPRTACGTTTLGDSGDTFTIPSGVTITNSGTATGFGSTGEVSWNTTKITADPGNAVSGVGYFTDTSGGAFNVTLPSSPSAGAVVAVADYANTWDTYNLTIARNGSNIEGAAENLVANIEGASITLVYVDATKGWVVTGSGNSTDARITPTYITATGGTVLTCGNYKTHVFTGPGTFCVSCAGNSGGSNSVEYVVVAGGGAGGRDQSGGGGAGGYRQNYPSPANAGLPVSAQPYSIAVGGGGTRPGCNGEPGNGGSNSSFSTITSTGGGGGSGNGSPSTSKTGGSGGGGDSNTAGSAGNTPPTTPSQGNPGGTSSSPNGAGGGGGAGGAGGNSSNPTAGNGGIGAAIATAFFGPTAPSYGTPGPAAGRYFAGGGGGSAHASPGTQGSGGSGGGGQGGGTSNPQPATAGATNTGGGGGGCGNNAFTSQTGGSGFVAIRYKFQN